MATVKLYGHLGARFGSEFTFDITRPSEAVRALMANFPAFEAALRPGVYEVVVDGVPIGEEQLNDPLGPARVIKIVPVVEGAGGQLSTIIGVALIAVALVVPGLQPLAAYAIGGLGAALTIGGLTSMLTPMPNNDNGNRREANRSDNRYFSSQVNTEAQGRAIPIVYGQFKVGSLVASSGTVIE